jgi:heme-degrading monooxygenase HmoA
VSYQEESNRRVSLSIWASWAASGGKQTERRWASLLEDFSDFPGSKKIERHRDNCKDKEEKDLQIVSKLNFETISKFANIIVLFLVQNKKKRGGFYKTIREK